MRITFPGLLVCFIISIFLINCSQGTTESQPAIDSSRVKAFAANFHEGQQLFTRYCTPCHQPPEKHQTDNYIFDNLFERFPKPDQYLTSFLQDSKALRAMGDKYSQLMQDDYNSTYEHHFRDSLSQDDLGCLLLYIKAAIKLKKG